MEHSALERIIKDKPTDPLRFWGRKLKWNVTQFCCLEVNKVTFWTLTKEHKASHHAQLQGPLGDLWFIIPPELLEWKRQSCSKRPRLCHGKRPLSPQETTQGIPSACNSGDILFRAFSRPLALFALGSGQTLNLEHRHPEASAEGRTQRILPVAVSVHKYTFAHFYWDVWRDSWCVWAMLELNPFLIKDFLAVNADVY